MQAALLSPASSLGTSTAIGFIAIGGLRVWAAVGGIGLGAVGCMLFWFDCEWGVPARDIGVWAQAGGVVTSFTQVAVEGFNDVSGAEYGDIRDIFYFH